MPHQLKIDCKGSYLHARVTGDNTAQDVMEYTAQVGAACMERGFARVLVEENLVGETLPASTIFSIVERGAKNARNHMEAIAYVDANPEHDHTAMEFGTSVAVKHGLNIRLFRTVEEAREWMEELEK